MNTKLKCILLDDELPSLTYVRMLCEQHPQVEVVKAFNDPDRFLLESSQLDFDLCILDIEMPRWNGLEIARKLNGKPIIFTTAYKEYAAEAFDLDAIDYIRKPIHKERFEKAIQKALHILNERHTAKYIQLNTSKGKARLLFDQILYITTAEKDKRDKSVLLTNGQYILVKNISFEKFLSILPEQDFCQINKKEIIALKTVQFFTGEEITIAPWESAGQSKTLSLSANFRASFLSKAG